jgi:ABC-type amino acid transport system permease subunit
VVILGVVLVVSGLLVGFADLMRPKEQRTHVGRFFDKVANDGFGGFALTLRRKAMENIDSFTGTKLLWILPIVAVLVWYLWRTPHGRIHQLFRDVPVIRQTMLALAVVAFLGYALNDSGVAIPSLMALVFECAVVYVALVPERKPVPEPPPVEPPDDATVYVRSPELV